MAKFIWLEEAKAFLNLEYVSLVTEKDGSLAVNIIDQNQTQIVSGHDAHNLLARLKMEAREIGR